jgi:hypothetical protein
MDHPFDVGQVVNHPRFGRGVTTRSDEERTTIDFENHGTKTFGTSNLDATAEDDTRATGSQTGS